MGFTKLSSGLLQSSIMAERPAVFKVFIAILASTDADGIARVSSTFLASACHFPLSIIDKAILILESPDPRSRSLNDDGRRIKRVDGGYFVINYEKYRAFTPQPGDPNSPGAIRTRKWREKKEGDVTETSQNHSDVSSASASSSYNNLIKEIEGVWNDFAHKHDIPWINGIVKGSARERTLISRLHDPDWDFNKLLEAIAAQPFLTGDNPRGWLVSFDWILKPANFQKIMEGVYAKKIRGDTVGENK